MQLSLIIKHFAYQKRLSLFHSTLPDSLPIITIQLPLYNELYVAERLLDAIIKIKYPKEKLEIQVLDDSTDETTVILESKVAQFRNEGFNIKLIHRTNRKGFKAGALKHGLAIAKGEFIAIFDADFVPDPKFLNQTVGYFADPKVGMVQSRWEHLNEKYSLLTKLQAFGLNAHFFIEQPGRFADGHFINFNGTAGIWRKSTIYDAGGWSPDTLTEDLDLSYRAQLKGWQFIYLRDLESPAELPVTIQAIKSQQYRWMKGGAECFMKNALKVVNSKETSFSTKVQGFYHLLNSSIFISVLALAIFSIPLVYNTTIFSKYHDLINLTTIFQVNWLILGSFYWLAFRRKSNSVAQFIGRFLTFLVFMMGMSLNNTLAVIEGLIGRKTPFIRTPKFNLSSVKSTWADNIYTAKKVGLSTWVELGMAGLFAFMIFVDIQNKLYGMVPFHAMTSFGYMLVSGYTFAHSRVL